MTLSRKIQAKTVRQHTDRLVQATDTFNELAILTLDGNGNIKNCNHAGADLLGCAPSIVTRKKISKFLPQLSKLGLLEHERVNPHLRFLSRIGFPFEVICMSGAHVTSQLFFSEAENLGQYCLRIIIQPAGARGELP